MEAINESERIFYKTLQSKLELVLQYENPQLREYAETMIPAIDLYMKANSKTCIPELHDTDVGLDDLMLIDLLNWFKCSFFTWVDKPKCEVCGEVSEERGIVSPNESEAAWNARTVELYFCSKCNISIRFPRYNHPKKLLETKRGRCGEWANCFTLLCRALHFDARLVFDWNDHVWTEVYSTAQKRWLHCDPCENICDKPLLYELGWKKPISYVIAFSKDGVQDVTWRYTSNFREVMERRNLCREEWVLYCITKLTEKLQANACPVRKSELAERQVLELAEFLCEPKMDGETYSGRVSGSLSWRIARGETQITPSYNAYIFQLTDKEVSLKRFHVKYSCALDKYVRVSDQCSENKNWSACTFHCDNIFRKVEADWKMVYLARTEKSDKGLIRWKFNFDKSGLEIHTLKIRLMSSTFENGKVNWLIEGVDKPFISKEYAANDVSLLTQDFEGCTCFTISAVLTKGVGEAAWQHAQLFRQAIDSTECPFEVEISLKKKKFQ